MIIIFELSHLKTILAAFHLYPLANTRCYHQEYMYWQNHLCLHYPNTSPEERALPECVTGFRKMKRKELARYSANDMWTMEEHQIFLKYCPSIRIRAYHAMALDTSARPHELLKLKIKDLKERVIKSNIAGTKDKLGDCVIYQFNVNGKTGLRALALTNSMSYVKNWLEHHEQRGNKDSVLFLNRVGRPLTVYAVYKAYLHYKQLYFPKLLQDPNVPLEDKEIIKKLLEERRWNPYVIRHSALTMKAKNRMMNDTMLRQHAGWSKDSKMPSVYQHHFGNESVDEMLRMEGYLQREDGNFDFNPVGIKKCGNCGCHNLPEAISCSKCKLLIDAVVRILHIRIQKGKRKNQSCSREQGLVFQVKIRVTGHPSHYLINLMLSFPLF
jgi:integrase